MSERETGADRRSILLGGTAVAATLAMPLVAHAAEDLADVKAAITSGHGAALKRLQDWIAFPSIAAEGRRLGRFLAAPGEDVRLEPLSR